MNLPGTGTRARRGKDRRERLRDDRGRREHLRADRDRRGWLRDDRDRRGWLLDDRDRQGWLLDDRDDHDQDTRERLRAERDHHNQDRRGRLRGDRGQAAIEFTGMVPIILGTMALLWQATLIGYTFSLAGNAADEAVRAGAVATGDRSAACAAAAEEDLPDAWSLGPVSCVATGDLVTAQVKINVPVLFPGFDIPVNITAHAAARRESD
jgi:hypothetical protein